MGWSEGSADPSVASASIKDYKGEPDEGEAPQDEPYGADDMHRPHWRRSEIVVALWIMVALTAALATNVGVGGALVLGRVSSRADLPGLAAQQTHRSDSPLMHVDSDEQQASRGSHPGSDAALATTAGTAAVRC